MTNFVITLKWVLLVITLTQARADDTHGIERRGTNSESKKIVCYYTNWSVYRPGTAKFTPQNINPYLCTHLIYAFGGLDKENGLRPYDKYQDIEQGGYAKFTGLKTYNKNLKTMLAIGGWNEGSSRFSNLVADEDRRAQFVKNVVKFLRQNNFDGLDLDWEYPAFRDGSKLADKDNYASLVKELREEFERESSKTGRSRLLLTMAVPAGIEYIDKGYDVPKLNRYLDFMNILSYDYHSAYEPNVNHHSPLYSLQEESEYNFDSQLTIDHTIKHYLKKGADPEKLILGIPTYGRSYTLFNPDSTDLGSPSDGPGDQGEATREKGYLAYYEICGNLGNDEWKIVHSKKSAMGPYAYRGNQWVGYDDADIVKLKAQFANEKGLGGIMYWSIDNDDFRGKCHGKPFPLIEAGKHVLLTNSGSPPSAVASSTEEKRTKLGNRKTRPKHHSTTPKIHQSKTTTTTTTTINPLSTPEPPTTPDPGTDFVCKEEGFFPHPRDCKKYFWCLDSGPSNLGIVAHQFTCPSGLLFNKAADSCDYSRNVICNKKSEKSALSTTTAKSTTITSSVSKQGITTSASTTTTTTESLPEEEYEEEDEDDDSQEDPKAIKELITLIKKIGGISELEKQLKIDDSSKEVTTPAISKTLYNKVFNGSPSSRFRNQLRNGPSGPQNEGLSSNDDVPYSRKDKPQYVTIQRSRPLKPTPQDTEDSGTTNNKSFQSNAEDEAADYTDATGEEEVTTTRYSSSPPRSRINVDSKTPSLKYVVLERNRADRTTTEDEELKHESPFSTQRYTTLIRHRPSTVSDEPEDQNRYTELSVRTTLKPLSRSDKEESVTEKPRDKPSLRIRGNFRRNNSSYTRSKSSSSTTSTTEYTPQDTNKLANRFRRRKGRPENRSINTARSENFIPLSDAETPTMTRYKNNDITHRGSTQISDYLPVPAPLYRLNQTNFDQLNANNINLEDAEAQMLSGSTEYNTDDISDLANPAVAAISNLKTVPPVPIYLKPVPSTAPQIMHTKEIPKEKFHVIKSTPKTTVADPIYQNKSSKRRGSSRGFARTTTTTQLPSLQDIYNDYQDSDLEYHADPVEIPITGKVRIHSDGYIECLDMGNFPHPFSCKKFISCAKMEYDSLLGWEYTCPKGLSFDPIGGICNWAAGLGCKE